VRLLNAGKKRGGELGGVFPCPLALVTDANARTAAVEAQLALVGVLINSRGVRAVHYEITALVHSAFGLGGVGIMIVYEPIGIAVLM